MRVVFCLTNHYNITTSSAPATVQGFRVAGIYLQVEQIAVAVEELVGGPAVDV